MKFNPTWQQVAFLAVLLGTILLAYKFVTPAAATITGTVTTIIGSLFVNMRGGPAPSDEPSPNTPPSNQVARVLTLVPKEEDKKA